MATPSNALSTCKPHPTHDAFPQLVQERLEHMMLVVTGNVDEFVSLPRTVLIWFFVAKTKILAE
jgi:hypothetical protein